MEVLKEIAYTLTRYQVRQVDVITNPDIKPSKKDNRYWEAYTGLREQLWQDDEEMARHFGMEYPGKNYNRFKNELKDRLWNTILFTETVGRDHFEYGAVYQNLLLKWAVAEILKLRGAFKAYRELATECLNTAQKYEFEKIVVDVCASLKAHYYINPSFKKEYQRIIGLYNEHWPVYMAEVDIRNAYEEFVTALATAKGYKKDFAPIADQLVDKFKANFKQIHSIQFQFHYRILHFYAEILRHDWHKALNVAEEAIGFLAGKRFQITSYLIGFNHQKVSCLLMLEKYEEARTVLDKTLELAAPDSTHHFKNRELATVIFLYAGNYVEAWQTCKNAIRHERFDKIPLIDQEAWRVYYGYLYFLALWGILELSPKEKSELPKFRLSSWLNDLPLFSADKRGAQIPILILQTLLLLFERRWDELDNRIEALRKFRQRNLDPNDEHFRTTCFIHLLELLPKFAFDLPTLSKNAAPWLKKLSSGNIEILDRTYEIEVVPYERQWDWVVTIIGAFK